MKKVTSKIDKQKKHNHPFSSGYLRMDCSACSDSMKPITKQADWIKEIDTLIRGQLMMAWEAGKKQKETPYSYTLDTDKLGQPIYDAISHQLLLERERVIKTIKEYIKDNQYLMASSLVIDPNGLLSLLDFMTEYKLKKNDKK